MPTIVHSRFDALLAALFGVGDHPEQVDVGPWRWSLRKRGPAGYVAVWRHKDDWDRTVVIRPVSPAAVVVDYPDGSTDGSFTSERKAIDRAVDWMESNT